MRRGWRIELKSARLSRCLRGILCRKPSAAFEATPLQYRAAIGRFGAFQESVRAGALALLWLIVSLHGDDYTSFFAKIQLSQEVTVSPPCPHVVNTRAPSTQELRRE
jgi:hypothetical protein